ncbi:hypothetical protein BXZ70DRAFT_53867 [Cristinia sonorae]|uniref:NAD(P)-binding protein n=1 Tax=Cristinia sonorae TaxID=1940300 RepID=A0A8K0XR86_9AGAR|nr:hypothetical protein BXZ70DRAFT_53867 [Cristinia sonorae]
MAPKVWLITGAASGFGRETTERALERGDNVVATDVVPEGIAGLQSRYPSDRLLVLKLDVSDNKDIEDGFAAAKKTFGKLDVVFSNAGYGVASELEGLPEDIARAHFDVNFWGSCNVGRAAVKFFREDNEPGVGGRLLFTTSVCGIACSPLIGIYVSSKHALEGYAQTLASELDPAWNIKVTIVEPGPFRTNAAKNMIHVPVHPAYTDPECPTVMVRNWLKAFQDVGGDPVKFSKQILRLVDLENPPLRIALGKACIHEIEQQSKGVLAGLKEYASWSDDLEYDK